MVHTNAMRLVLDTPESWKPDAKNGEVQHTLEQGLVVVVPPVAAIPEDVWHWSHYSATRDVPRGASEVVVTEKFDRTTELGWPIAIYESVAKRPDGTVLEARIHAVYALVDNGTIVAAYSTTVEQLAARRDEILATLATARPDFGVPDGASLRDLLLG